MVFISTGFEHFLKNCKTKWNTLWIIWSPITGTTRQSIRNLELENLEKSRCSKNHCFRFRSFKNCSHMSEMIFWSDSWWMLSFLNTSISRDFPAPGCGSTVSWSPYSRILDYPQSVSFCLVILKEMLESKWNKNQNASKWSYLASYEVYLNVRLFDFTWKIICLCSYF